MDEYPLTEKSFFLSLALLASFYMSFALFIILEKRNYSKNIFNLKINNKVFYRVVSIFLALLGINFFRELEFMSKQLDERPGFIDELIRFCFHDAAIFMSLCLLNIGRLNEKNSKNVAIFQTLFIILCLIYFTSLGSKGAVLTAILLCIVIPISCASILGLKSIILPTGKSLFFLGLFAPPLFFLGLYFRNLMSQVSAAFSDPVGSLWLTLGDSNEYRELVLSTLYRLSADFNRYLLISTEFFQNGNYLYRLNLFTYTIKNTLNLFLPGTPFPESYFMSSMYLPNILSRIPFESGDYLELILKMNTQPYTIFGFFIIFLD